MNKLQLYITMSKGDFRHIADVNAHAEVKAYVGDLRSAVCQVDYQASSKNIFYLLKYTDKGAFIIVLRTIPDVTGNNLAAWIFCPYSCKIADKDLCSAVEFVADKVAGHSLNNQIFGEIRQLFSHEYEDDPLAPIFAPTDGKAYAYRYYNGNTGVSLCDLIGRFRYQPCYLPFAGVLLVDSAISDNVSGTNLTSAPKETMAVLMPADTADADGYRPTIYACPFDVPYFAPMDRTFDIVWVKPGAPNVKQPVMVSKSEMQAPSFEEYTRPVTVHAVKEHAENEHKAEIKPKQEEKKFFDSDTSDTREEDNAGEEYAAEEYGGNAEESSFFDKYSDVINNVLYTVGGFLLGVAVTLLVTCERDSEPIETPHTPAAQNVADSQAAVDAVSALAEQQPAEETPQTAAPEESAANSTALSATETPAAEPQSQPSANANADIKAAIAYIDNHTTWKKSEMEKYPDLKGLYDDMNKVDRQSIINKWGPKLKSSKKFSNIVTHAKLSKKKKARRVPYNSPKASSFPLQDYLNNMDP